MKEISVPVKEAEMFLEAYKKAKDASNALGGTQVPKQNLNAPAGS